MSGRVEYDVADGIARITLDRAEVSNAVDLPTATALDAAVEAAAADEAVRVLLMSGAGPRFCAGGDLASMLAADDRAGYVEALATELDAALQRLLGVAKPVVAAVHGAVAGAGLAVLLSCDLVVADESTRFTSAYAGIGLTPDCGLSWLLPRAVGQMRALELLLTPRVLSAGEARDIGLITSVVAEGMASSRALELATALATGPAYALGQARRLVRSAWDQDRAALGRDEARTIALAVETAEARARLERFTGR
jgi:2-(1,2-epoxy-1,2-dihydrophenyl)acetyl-CoA isomerase